MTAAAHFSQSYAEARGRFLEAAGAAALPVQSHAHPLLGRDGEELAMDVVRDGPADAQALLVISSACHGVEGFCGSGVQVTLLRDTAWREAADRAGVAVLYIHGLNPYGFSWWRRTTHENVDLNRNFHDFGAPLPRNAAYDECPQAEYTGIALEYGTLPTFEVTTALRADQWLENHPEADTAQRQAIKRQVRDAFYTDTDEWKVRILEQGLDAAHGAVRGLATR